MFYILTPIHKKDHFVEFYNSILAQTYKDFKVILVANGDLRKEDFPDLDPRFEVYDTELTGISNALNLGLSKIPVSKDNWIIRMDADDVMNVNRLQFTKDYIVSLPNDITIASSLMTHLYNDERFDLNAWRKAPYNSEVHLYPKDVYNELQKKNVIAHPATAIRSDAVEKYNPECDGYEDWDLWRRIVTPKNAIVFRYPLTAYRLKVNKDEAK